MLSLMNPALGNVWIFGSNNLGQLGIGSLATNIFIPTSVPSSLFSNEKIIFISAGYYNSLTITGIKIILFLYNIITESGRVFVAGDNSFGQLGLNYTGSFISNFTNIPPNQLNCNQISYASIGSQTILIPGILK